MFGRAATEFADRMSEPYNCEDPRAILAEGVRRFLEFCTSDVARYQLLFQRTIPGFEPTEQSLSPAVRALDGVRDAWPSTMSPTSSRQHVDPLSRAWPTSRSPTIRAGTAGHVSSMTSWRCFSPIARPTGRRPARGTESRQASPLMTIKASFVTPRAARYPRQAHRAGRRQRRLPSHR